MPAIRTRSRFALVVFALAMGGSVAADDASLRVYAAGSPNAAMADVRQGREAQARRVRGAPAQHGFTPVAVP
jgi:hypothetical protein